LLKVQMKLSGGLHNPKMLARQPSSYLKEVLLTDPTTGDTSEVKSFTQLIQGLANGFCLPPPKTQANLLGLTSPGALLLPVSARVPNEVYQPIVLASYPRSLLQMDAIPLERPAHVNEFALKNAINGWHRRRGVCVPARDRSAVQASTP